MLTSSAHPSALSRAPHSVVPVASQFYSNLGSQCCMSSPDPSGLGSKTPELLLYSQDGNSVRTLSARVRHPSLKP